MGPFGLQADWLGRSYRTTCANALELGRLIRRAILGCPSFQAQLGGTVANRVPDSPIGSVREIIHKRGATIVALHAVAIHVIRRRQWSLKRCSHTKTNPPFRRAQRDDSPPCFVSR